ncbi:MAG: hypothetical protein ACT4QC_02360 [Planctomycetaceae bacterium]
MDTDDFITTYFVLTEKPRPPQPRRPLGPIGWFTFGLFVLTLAMIVARIVRGG